MRTATIDIETNGLLADMLDYSSFPYKLNKEAKIWVVSITDMQDMKTTSLVKENITKESLDALIKDFDVIVAHNGMKFDFIALMLFGLIDYRVGYLGERDTLNGREVRLIDSLIMSRFVNPDRLGGHSLNSWGQRVGSHKTDYRGELVTLGAIDSNLPKGDEFKMFHPLMVEYCEQDTIVNAHAYVEILKEYKGYDTAKMGLQLEHKLADLAIRRETLGFWFDKELALSNVEELTEIMEGIQKRVNPILPKKRLTKTEISNFTPPKNQIKKDGTWSSHMLRFFERLGIEDHNAEQKYFIYKEDLYEVPYEMPLETEREATVDDLDVVKEYLLELGWEPSEWAERDLTRDSKKQIVPLDKKRASLERYISDTLDGKYRKERMEILKVTEDNIESKMTSKLNERSFRVPTAPKIRVGVTKDMCPNLIALGDKVDFAKDVADYYTYRHRKSAIAGGDITDMDFDTDIPETGYLSNYREEDGRIPTPSIEIGAGTHRYRHIGVANVPRTSSLYGENMRALFGAGEGAIQFAYDFSSLEARIEGIYVYPYEGGKELAESLLAEKPNDIHSVNARKLGISRTDAKSFGYAVLYGASAGKLSKMLSVSQKEGERLYKEYWDSNPALKELKEDKEREWIQSGRKYIKSIDGRRINIRSQHSILNALFQSAGVICAKYINVFTAKRIEELGYCIDVFKDEPDFAEMISYHDEINYRLKSNALKFKTFKSEGLAKEFVDQWDGEQLGAIQELKKGVFFVTLPSDFSISITESIKTVQDMFKLDLDLGIEIQVGRNWKETH